MTKSPVAEFRKSLKNSKAVRGHRIYQGSHWDFRAVEYTSDDSEASWLIYIIIWQHLRRKGSSKTTRGEPTGKRKKSFGPTRT